MIIDAHAHFVPQALLDEALVERVIVEHGRATGVRYHRAGEAHEIRAAEVVLCAGAYGSPAILQRSGIGPAEWLKPLGVDVVSDLAVGRNLTDHPGFPMLFRAEGLGVTTGRFFA